MKYSEVKKVIQLANNIGIDSRELAENVSYCSSDFDVENYRFIVEVEAIENLCEIYESDLYILGCFNSSFISYETGINYKVVEALQKAGAYEELGQLILDYLNSDLTSFIEAYVRIDGYGHAFGSYNHSYDEINLNGTDYIYFRTY